MAEPDDDDDDDHSDAQRMFAVESEPDCGVLPASWQERRMLKIGNSAGCAGASGAQAVCLDVRDQISGWGDWAEALFKPKMVAGTTEFARAISLRRAPTI